MAWIVSRNFFLTFVRHSFCYVDFTEQYEEAVEAVTQTAVAHQKKYKRHMFSRVSTSAEEKQRALVQDLSEKPDVWLAEQVYQATVQELNRYWDKHILGQSAKPAAQQVQGKKDNPELGALGEGVDESDPSENASKNDDRANPGKESDPSDETKLGEETNDDGSKGGEEAKTKSGSDWKDQYVSLEGKQSDQVDADPPKNEAIHNSGEADKYNDHPEEASDSKGDEEDENKVDADQVASSSQIEVMDPDPRRSFSQSLPPIRALLKQMAELEASRRVDVAAQLKDWLRGQERLMVGSESATALGWMDWTPNTESSYNEANDDKNEKTENEGSPEDVTTSENDEHEEDTRKFVPANTMTETQLKERRAQLQEQVKKTLSQKWSTTVADDWLEASAQAEDTYQVMDEVFGIDAYLESPHVVSAAVGEWWKIDRPRDSKGTAPVASANAPVAATDDDNEPERRLALVIISSGPQMHIYNLSNEAVVLDLETPPHDALWELLSGQSLPCPTVSIPLADAQVRMTDELDTLEIIPAAASDLPCIRMLCPHLNNIY